MDDMTCPQCGTRMRYDFSAKEIRCPACGFSPLEAKMAEVKAEGPPSYGGAILYRGELSIHARSAFNTGQDQLHDGKPEQALESFKRALSAQPDFIDAHLAIADLVEDEATKRDHLGAVLAYDNNNPEALRRLMVLNGRLSEAEAARSYHYNDQQVEQIDTVEADHNETLICPVCGGTLTVDAASGQVRCKHCGYVAVQQPSRNVGADSLTMALLERKAQPVRWVVGKRILHCQQCGAERTIPARKMRFECPFCGSTQVIQQDPRESLEQPDGLVRFRISRDEASARIRAEMDTLKRRIVNIFDNNRIAYQTIEGLYLPFWVFDTWLDVTETRTYMSGQGNDTLFNLRASQPVYEENTFSDAMLNIPVCAVTSPAPALTRRLTPYRLDEKVAYQPKLLAKFPAQLYDIDFDKASLDAHSIASKTMRRKHEAGKRDSEQMRIRISALVKNMSFQLLLLPVWVVSVIEEDDDRRSILVNGQTGEVILGKVQKRDRP